MQVYKIADLTGADLRFRDDFPFLIAVVRTLEQFRCSEAFANCEWRIANFTAATVPVSVNIDDALVEPVFFPVRQFIMYQSQLFYAEYLPNTAEECAEIISEVKKRVSGKTSEPRISTS